MMLIECRNCCCLLGCQKLVINKLVTTLCASCLTANICFIHILFRANEFIPTLADDKYLCEECVQYLLGGGGNNGEEQ